MIKQLLNENFKGQINAQKSMKKWELAKVQKNNIMKGQIDKIHKKEKKRTESIQKYLTLEKNNAKKLRKDHKKLIEK